MSERRTRLVLVGLGHVHARLLAHRHQLSDRIALTLVAPHDGYYGGVAANLLAGDIEPCRLRITRPTDFEYRAGRMMGAQPVHRRLWLTDGTAMTYDALSLNIGTRRLAPFAEYSSSGQPRVWSGHSIRELAALSRAVEASSRIVIAGGTERALEIAGGLSTKLWSRRHVRITLLEPNAEASPRTRQAHRRLAWRGVDIVSGVSANGLGPACVHAGHDRRFVAEHFVWAGPPMPTTAAQALGLPVNDRGLEVDRRLQSPRSPRVWASGAMAALKNDGEVPGWDIDRQVEVVLANLQGLIGEEALKSYRCPRSNRQALDLGDHELIARWGRLAWQRRHLAAVRRQWIRDID